MPSNNPPTFRQINQINIYVFIMRVKQQKKQNYMKDLRLFSDFNEEIWELSACGVYENIRTWEILSIELVALPFLWIIYIAYVQGCYISDYLYRLRRVRLRAPRLYQWRNRFAHRGIIQQAQKVIRR